MPWVNVPTKNPGDPVTAENWNGLVGNFEALASGVDGAPAITIPGNLHTDEIDTTKALQPDGNGGVQWGNPVSGLVGGEHADLNGGASTTQLPDDKLFYVYHVHAHNTSNHTIVMPNPSAANAGHQIAIQINQTGTYGRTFIRIGHTGGDYLAQVADGETYRAIFISDGEHWMAFATYHYVPDDDHGN